ncbi:MAG: aspartate--tRNA ligase [Candidatus Omnitrophica bacterium]|nr:aspartate--tRNA ligase [Candidatus Omnitrophota bacterium]
MKRSHRCGELRSAQIGDNVVLYGWVHRRRDHGGLIFIDLRDRTGLIQILFSPENKDLFSKAKELRPEFVLEVQGKVRKRPSGTENPNLSTGEVEVVSETLIVLNSAKTPPFEIEEEGNASEELRLTYRYLDLRRKKMQENLLLRHQVCQIARNFLDREGFVEVETPILTKSTPEGARDYLVPSRLSLGKFYALPQSPQLFKQLLMVSGLDRYFQISRCFRDEDLRADRQPEFTQVDLEMSFPDEKEIFSLIERLLKEIFEKSPLGKKITLPFPQMTYETVLHTYGADSPDLRFGVTLTEVTDLLSNCGFEKFQSVTKHSKGGIFGLLAPGGSPLSEKQIEILRNAAKEGKPGAKDLAPFKVEKGSLVSHITKYFKTEALERIVQTFHAKEGDLVLLVADENADVARKALGRVRDQLKEKEQLNLLKGKENECAFVWITDFPLFEKDEEGHWTSTHHPFTAPHQGDMRTLSSDPGKVRAHAYDIVLNGIELGSGSIRIHERKVQEEIFKILRLSEQEQKDRFGFLLEAFTYGAPPHGGIAFGLDRLVAMLVDLRDRKLSDTSEATSIREVIAFPKTQKGSCPLTNAPSDVSREKLKELGLSTKPS